MAFSYSDKNFTVIGNLCFVHIFLDGTKNSYDIPPAIADRILFDGLCCTYSYSTVNKARGIVKPEISFALIVNHKIILLEKGTGYLYFHFPIDSNK